MMISMTARRITVSLPDEQIAAAQAAVAAGAAASISSYVSRALAAQQSKDALVELLEEFDAEFGSRSDASRAWARSALGL